MTVCYKVEVDEAETDKSVQELLDIGLYALKDAYDKLGCYFDVGYNPQTVTTGRAN